MLLALKSVDYDSQLTFLLLWTPMLPHPPLLQLRLDPQALIPLTLALIRVEEPSNVILVTL